MILAIDQGTTNTTALVITENGAIAARASQEFTQHFPQPGWVEHDAAEIWDTTLTVMRRAVQGAHIEPADIRAIGITNQRETVVAWDRRTGEPLHNALVWQDRRTAARCDELRAAGHEQLIRERTGLTLDPYFSATKIEWLLNNAPDVTPYAAFGTIDSWLAFKLTGRHVTDYSNASRTMLFDIERLCWDEQLCELFGVPIQSLPEVRPSSEIYGSADPELFGASVPVAGMAGDQQAALFGQACVDPGLGKNTYGTGSFVLINSGSKLAPQAEGLVRTIGWGIGDHVDYALEASVFVAGAAVQWLRDGLGLIESAPETENLAASVQSNGGVYFVPALAGLGSPHWDPYARGAIFGLTRGTQRAHLARAALEAIAFQTVDAVEAMQAAAGLDLQELHADGGATANNWLMQFQADVLGVPVVVPEIVETTALGAAFLAGIATGIWTQDEVCELWREAKRFEPSMDEARAAELLQEWRQSVEATRSRGEPKE